MNNGSRVRTEQTEFKSGQYIFRYHDSVAFGVKIVFGRIETVLPKTYKILWEFGNTQYVKHLRAESDCAIVTNKDELIECYKIFK